MKNVNSKSSVKIEKALQKAIELAQTGQRTKALRLLAKIVERDRKNVYAWLALSTLVEQPERKQECLDRVLRIEPRNKLALEILDRVNGKAIADHRKEYTSDNRANQEQRTHKAKQLPDPLNAWLIPSPEEQAAESLSDYLPIESLLIDDIAKLPIITSPHQELWLGIQLKAPRQLKLLDRSNENKSFYTLCDSLLANYKTIEENCLSQDIQPPRLEVWTAELISVRNNIYDLRRAKLRRFIRRVQKQVDEETNEHLVELSGKVAETLCLFPNEVLKQIVDFLRTQDHLPPIEEIRTWLAKIASVKMIAAQTQKRAQKAKDVLITGYLRYALSVARNYVDQGVDYVDLVQEGFLGLMRAAEKFDYRIQVRFGSYATTWIWQAVGRAISDQSRIIRLPAHAHEQLKKLKKASDLLDIGHTDPPTNPEILCEADLLDPADLKRIQKANKKDIDFTKAVGKRYQKAVQKAQRLYVSAKYTIPLDFPVPHPQARLTIDRSHTITVADIIADREAYTLYEQVETDIVHQVIEQEIFPLLKPRQQQVLRLRYGLKGGKERTLKEVGQHFGFTRERARQIETAALEQIEMYAASNLIPNLVDLLPSYELNVLRINDAWLGIQSAFDEEQEKQEWGWLDKLLDKLPRSDWVEGRHAIRRGTRREQLLNAIESFSSPAHISEITDEINENIDSKPLTEEHIYNLLFRGEEDFILLGQGVFSLVKWEQIQTDEKAPSLSFCPALLPDPPDYEHAFFESVLIGREKLLNKLTAEQFIHQMLQWAQADADQQKWFLQSILSAYYLVDLIPYVFFFGGDNPTLQCTLPDLEIQELRYHCLQTATERLVAMPEFWWLFRRRQPIRPSALGEEFADIHPNGLDDALHRLYLLTNLGAAYKLKYGRYRLTNLGEECADRWSQALDLETLIESEESESDIIDDFATFAIW